MRRIATLTVVGLLVLAAVATGQMPPRGGQNPGGPPPGPGGPPPQGQPQGPPPEVVLKELLGFTEAQLVQLQALIDARRVAIEALQPKIAEAERALGEALRVEHPDACNVGGKLLAVESLRKQVGAADEAFRTGFRALLTADQQAKVEQIFTLQASLAAADVLHRLGL